MLSSLISALNSMNQPWVAIIVIMIGMIFDIICKHFGVANDAATGVIGAGVGLLTGQGLRVATEHATVTTQAQPQTTIDVKPTTATPEVKE